MKNKSVITGCIFFFVWMLFVSMKPLQSLSFEPVAVIELFSSQGCSSCPPADRLLTKTILEAEKSGKNIFALSFHVDYWDRLGWKDPFSSKQFSERQNTYSTKLKLNSNYTPQMLVNGTKEFVGSDANALGKALNAALMEKAEVVFKDLKISGDQKNDLHVTYELEGVSTGSKINFALVSITEKTSVKRGENNGSTLINDHVVNQFISQDAKQKGEIIFSTSPVPAKENTLLIAFIQNSSTLKITGAAQVKPGSSYKPFARGETTNQ